MRHALHTVLLLLLPLSMAAQQAFPPTAPGVCALKVPPAGPAYAVYWNSPFTPWFLKRYEVHVRVRPRGARAAQ